MIADASIDALIGKDVRLAFVDETILFCTLRARQGEHLLVRARGERHPMKVRIAVVADLREQGGG